MNSTSFQMLFMDRILDPVHGFIDITEVESKIIELPIFKRLESIKQLSVTNWIFPGAEHTRYSHSLGVMHICDQMAKNLKRMDGSLRFNDKQRQTLRLAGLLHDIGHYPLSHVTEDVYIHEFYLEKRPDSILFGLHDDVKNDIGKLQRKSTPEYMKSRYTREMHHEKMGTEVIRNDAAIRKIIEKYCPFVCLDDICDIIVGCVDNIVDKASGEVNQDLSVMAQLMHSELDADGIDYILRDASFSGTSYGAFELELLLRNLVVSEYEGIEIIGIRPKGISVADQYLISKYFSYTQVIFNRHVSVLEVMVRLYTQCLIRDKGVKSGQSRYCSPQKLLELIQECNKVDDYLKFTDRSFWSSLDQNDKTHAELESEAMGIIFDRLSHYQELEMIPDSELIWTSADSEKVYEELTASGHYADLVTNPEDRLYIFLKKGFTSEIKEDKFKAILKDIDIEVMGEDIITVETIKRMQEGITVLEEGKEPRLLVDEPRSVVGYLGDASTYIFRGYYIR